MANSHHYLHDGQTIDHTPAAEVTGGQLIQVGSLSVLSSQDIAAAAKGAVTLKGVVRMPYVGGVASIGDNIWWDADGTPYGGDADGAATIVAADGDWWAGTIVNTAPTATSTTVDVAINEANPNLPAWPNRAHFTTAVDLTFVEATHSGGVIHVTVDAKTVTLPVGTVGMEVIVVNDCADGTGEIHVDLNGNETIVGANLTIAATKTADNTKATANRGDYLHLRSNAAAGSWTCVAKRGVWVTST